MKKLYTLLVMVLTAITANAQMVVDAEMFKSNPNQFMGKVVTIKNVTLVSSSCHAPSVSGPVNDVSVATTPTPAPVGIVGKNTYCNPAPKFTLTKWSFGPNNEQCLQADARVLPMLPAQGAVAKEVSFRVTPQMLVITRIAK